MGSRSGPAEAGCFGLPPSLTPPGPPLKNEGKHNTAAKVAALKITIVRISFELSDWSRVCRTTGDSAPLQGDKPALRARPPCSIPTYPGAEPWSRRSLEHLPACARPGPVAQVFSKPRPWGSPHQPGQPCSSWSLGLAPSQGHHGGRVYLAPSASRGPLVPSLLLCLLGAGIPLVSRSAPPAPEAAPALRAVLMVRSTGHLPCGAL